MRNENLNSVHLEWPRREAFRHARASLENACGAYTQLQMFDRPRPNLPRDHAVSPGPVPQLPDHVEYGLLDDDKIHPLTVGINTVGRMPDNDVIIEDPHVSRRHCAIVVHATDGFELHDVASKNGTFLNGIRLNGPAPLASGDEIRMCDHRLIFITRDHLPRADVTLPK